MVLCSVAALSSGGNGSQGGMGGEGGKGGGAELRAAPDAEAAVLKAAVAVTAAATEASDRPWRRQDCSRRPSQPASASAYRRQHAPMLSEFRPQVSPTPQRRGAASIWLPNWSSVY